MNPEQQSAMIERLVELAAERPDVKQQLDDLLFSKLTDQPPNGEGYACLKKCRDNLKSLEPTND